MINSVRNTVLSILNKNNYGYISPSDFNLFAKQAQLDIFENYFFDYNYQINKENARQSGTGYADLKQNDEEVIDSFSVTSNLTVVAATNTFTLPSDWYLLNSIFYDAQATPAVPLRQMERVSQKKIRLLLNSNITSPNTLYPAYTMEGNILTAYPVTINTQDDVVCQYIRYPKDPKWTYVDVPTATGEPLFDSTAADYQDFEIPVSDEPTLVVRILEYAGLSIRESDVVQVASSMDTRETTSEK